MVDRLRTVHGAYYLLTGLWPLLSMRSFEWVTGRKTDRWLVRMVGLLAASIGLALLRGGRAADAGTRAPGPSDAYDEPAPTERTLALASAASFAAIDVVYTLKGTIRPIYLGDAVVEGLLFAGWLRARPATSGPGVPAGRPAASTGEPPRTAS